MNPFYEVTKILSGKKYPTLSIGLMAYNFLKRFLSKFPIDAENNLEQELKTILLEKLEFHFSKKISNTQSKITKVINLKKNINFLEIVNLLKLK